VHDVDPDIPVELGGQAAASSDATARTGATALASDGAQAIEIFTDLARARRPLWHANDSSDADNEDEGERTA
jgi:hypothetical protein